MNLGITNYVLEENNELPSHLGYPIGICHRWSHRFVRSAHSFPHATLLSGIRSWLLRKRDALRTTVVVNWKHTHPEKKEGMSTNKEENHGCSITGDLRLYPSPVLAGRSVPHCVGLNVPRCVGSRRSLARPATVDDQHWCVRCLHGTVLLGDDSEEQ